MVDRRQKWTVDLFDGLDCAMLPVVVVVVSGDGEVWESVYNLGATNVQRECGGAKSKVFLPHGTLFLAR